MIFITNNIVFITGIIAVCFFVSIIIVVLVRNNTEDNTEKQDKAFKPNKDKVYNISLLELSNLWSKNKKKIRDSNVKISVGDLAEIWTDKEVNELIPSKYKVNFTDIRLKEFYNNYIDKPYFNKAKEQKIICIKLMNVLEQWGNCPSVVDKNRMPQDAEILAKWDASTYSTLRRITLTEHTLNVCQHIADVLIEDNSTMFLPNALIAGLGHDIGKIESLQGDNYALGDHPLTAGSLLNKTKGFNDLSKQEEILNAIKLHHKTPSGYLGTLLKQSDQFARQMELEAGSDDIELGDLLETAIQEKKAQGIKSDHTFKQNKENKDKQDNTQDINIDNNINNKPVSNVSNNNTAEVKKQDNKTDNGSVWATQKAIYGIGDEEKSSKTKISIQKLGISWFDEDAFVADMKPYINRMFGNRFMAFSMSNGYVYFQTKVLEEVARKQSKKDMEVASIPKKDDEFRGVLLPIVDIFRDNGKLAKEFVQEGYFGGYFKVSFHDGKTMRGFYTPFHSEAFGNVGAMEASKPPRLKQIRAVEISDE